MTLSSEAQEEEKVLPDVTQHGSGELGPGTDPKQPEDWKVRFH